MDRMTELRAGQLAALPALKISLPAAAADAIAAYQAAMKLPVPAEPSPYAVQHAIARRAAELVREPLGKLPDLVTDMTPAVAAEQAAAQAAHRQALVLAVKAAAAEQVCQVMTEHAAQVHAAIQARHKTVITELASRAARLPSGIDTEGALTAGGRVREDYLRCRDLITELHALRAGLAQAQEPAAAEMMRNDGVAVCTQWEQSGTLYRRHWLAGDSTRFSWPRRAKSKRPHPASSNFFRPYPAGARTSCNMPGRSSLVAAKDRSRWGRNIFANDHGGAGRTWNGGAHTTSQNHAGDGTTPA
jgi:hypothetical protein